MNTVQVYFSVLVAAILAALLLRQYQSAQEKSADQGRLLFSPITLLFDAPLLKRGDTAGVWAFTGRYRNEFFQLKTVADTLATRKLPSLWFMVTLPEPQPVTATVDLMMRAAGVTSFSNFDFLSHALALPAGFPEQSTIRSDNEKGQVLVGRMRSHLRLFHHGRGKELLISPKGLRIVVQLAEGDRARYGVFREANFAGTTISVALAKEMMDSLISLRDEIRDYAKT